MPTSLFCKVSRPNFSLKGLSLVAIFLISPLFFFGQTLTGLWTGALSNDSNTVRKDQSFEIALTEYKGKVYGYSRSEFIVDDVLYYVVKRVKGTINGDMCEVSDDEIISFNFPTKLDKGVKVVSTFRRSQSDSAWHLEGTWKTNATKKYYAVTGKVGLQEEKDLTASKIFPHLEELKLADDVAFYKERKEGIPIAKIAKPEKVRSEYTTVADKIVTNNNDVAVVATPTIQRVEAKPVVAETLTEKTTAPTAEVAIANENIPVVKKPTVGLEKTETKEIPSSNVDISPAAVVMTKVENKVPEVVPETKATLHNDEEKTTKAAIAAKNTTNQNTTAVQPTAVQTGQKEKPVQTNAVVKNSNNPTTTKPTTTSTTQVDTKAVAKNDKPTTQNNPVKLVAVVQQQNTSATTSSEKPDNIAAIPTTEKKEPVITPGLPTVKKPVIDITLAAANIGGRKSEFSQIVNFKTDSLELSLYDNGEIDGDTVSVFMNGQIIMSRQGLKASAIKKTIYITPGNEDFTLVLFAENLGKYPPNTGLLVVHDGNDIYNLRFSSDFQKNAGIVFRRKQ